MTEISWLMPVQIVEALTHLCDMCPLISHLLPKIFLDLGSTDTTGTATGSEPFQPLFLRASSMWVPPALMDRADQNSAGTGPLWLKTASLIKAIAFSLKENGTFTAQF